MRTFLSLFFRRPFIPITKTPINFSSVRVSSHRLLHFMMKSFLFVLLLAGMANAFVQHSKAATSSALQMGYVPDGMTPEQYKKLKEKEREEMAKKKLGAYGIQSFKSRSLQSFQKDLEAGKAGHLMPVLDAKKKLQEGKIKKEDIPYMQRLGSWDDSDVGKKKKWTKDDEKYNQNEKPFGLDWKGANTRTGPPKRTPPKAAAKPSSPPKKKFGLF